MHQIEKFDSFFPSSGHKVGLSVTLIAILVGSILAPFILWLLAPVFLVWVFWLARRRWLGPRDERIDL